MDASSHCRNEGATALGRGDAGLSEMPSPVFREKSRKAAPPVSLAGNCRFSAYGISDFRIEQFGVGSLLLLLLPAPPCPFGS